MKNNLILKTLLLAIIAFVLAGCFSLKPRNDAMKTKSLVDQKKINAIFIGHSHMNKQEFLIPEILRECGSEITERHCYAPGQSFEGHI